MENKTRLRAVLDSLFANQKPIPTAGGQMCGAEVWQLRFSGSMQGEVYEALNESERQNAEMLAMLKSIRGLSSNVHNYSDARLRMEVKDSARDLDELIKKVEGENGK